MSASRTQASNSTVNELSLMLAGQRSLRRSTPVCSRNPRFPEGFAVERRKRVSSLPASLIFITRILSARMAGFNFSFDLSQWPTFPYIAATDRRDVRKFPNFIKRDVLNIVIAFNKIILFPCSARRMKTISFKRSGSINLCLRAQLLAKVFEHFYANFYEYTMCAV